MSFIPQRISVGTISSVTGTTGTGAAGRVAYWSDATTLTSDSAFTFDGTTMSAKALIARNDNNGATRIQVRNDNTGASAFAQLKVTSDSGDINVTANSAAGGDSVALTADSTFGGGMDVGILGNNALRLRTNGTAQLTIAGSGESTFAGPLSVEAGTGGDTMFRVRGNSQTTGVIQFGTIIDTIFSNSATTGVFGIASSPQLANSAFTCGYAYGFYAGTITPLGGTATLTRAISFFATAQTNGTNNASIADNVTFTGNWFINSTNTAQSLFSGNITVSSSGGPQYVAKDGGAFGTNADPHIQFEDTTGSGGRIGFTDGASKDFKIQNQTDTGLLDFVTTATQIAGSAGASTGTYWTIKLGGTTYKLLLYANA